MKDEFGLWLYNIIVSKEFLASVCGGIIGGLASIFVAKMTLSSEFKNQRKIESSQNKRTEKSTFLMVKDELEKNRIVITGYVKSTEDQNTKMFNIQKALEAGVGAPSDEAWRAARSILFLSENEVLVKKISELYKGIYAIITVKYISLESPKYVLEQLDDVIDDISKIYDK